MMVYSNYEPLSDPIPELPPGFIPWWQEKEQERWHPIPLELPVGRAPEDRIPDETPEHDIDFTIKDYKIQL